MNVCCFLLAVFCGLIVQVDGGVTVVDGSDPGSCDKSNHADELLVKDREEKDKKIICTEKDGVYQWIAIDGSTTPGEFFNPGFDCSDILDKDVDAKDGFYWIKMKGQDPKKVWCDMTTDGGGFMLIGRKNDSVTWTVPSNDDTVDPLGSPHWSSALGDTPILDFRIQMASSEDFDDTKAHWSFRLQNERALKNLMVVNQGGCGRTTAGIGDIAYVKDLQTETIVSTTLRCSNFGYGHHPLTGFGWTMMNSCLEKPCSLGFAYHHTLPLQTDYSGGFSYSATGNVSGIDHDATAFVGCDNGQCCGCYGPVGGTQHYCTQNCRAINGGTITTNTYTWFWVRSSLPKRLWKKCMEYTILDKKSGKPVWYNILGDSAVPKKGRCNTHDALLHDGIAVVQDESTAEKIPPISGLLAFRKDTRELYLRANKTWNVVAQKKQVLQEAAKEAGKMTAPNAKKIKELEHQETELNDTIAQLKKQIQFLNHSHSPAHTIPECSSYQWLTDANRYYGYSGNTGYCDSHLNGWYRFGGSAGTKMYTSCRSGSYCGSSYPGWMYGGHPSVSDGKVTRTVYFYRYRSYSSYSSCRYWSTNVEVINCGHYYVYKLQGVPTCNARYCTTT